jgi:hypothetical protein
VMTPQGGPWGSKPEYVLDFESSKEMRPSSAEIISHAEQSSAKVGVGYKTATALWMPARTRHLPKRAASI